MHSGGNGYPIHPLAGYQLREGDVGRIQRAAAIAFGLDLVWGTGGLPGRSLSAAGERGLPAIYVEMPGEGRCRPEDRRAAVRGIRNVLAFLGILEGEYPGDPPRHLVELPAKGSGHLQGDHLSPTSGLFIPAVAVWDRVTAGQRLGEVRDPDGTVLARVACARDGRVLFLRTLPRVVSGDPLAFVLPLPEKTVL
jgi:predicted deacylase